MISHERFAAIRAIILDIDGVLTDGRVGYGAPDFIKFFHYRDGHWLTLAHRAGLIVGALSGRKSAANRARAAELKFDFCREDVHDKLAGFEEVLADFHLKPEECLYVGDDLIDMPVLRRAGIAVTVADGVAELDEVVDWRLPVAGGHGAMVELVRRLLIEKGLYEAQLERYRR